MAEQAPTRDEELLIVDDDGDMVEILTEYFRSEGFRVRVARDGAEGYRIIQAAPPDVIMLDVEMPRLTGPELALAVFLHNCGLEKIPVVLASGELSLHRIAARVGTPYFLPKPYELDAAKAMLERALRERRAPYPRLPVSAERRGGHA